MKPRGIMFKTFMFTTALITLVSLMSFGILYAVLPRYYVYLKAKTLNRNADVLAGKLMASADNNEIKTLMAKFCTDNNATVSSFATKGEILPELSYPLIMLADGANLGYTVAVTWDPGSGHVDIRETSKVVIGGVAISSAQAIRTSSESDADRTGFFVRRTSEDQSISLTREINSDVVGAIDIVSTLQPIDEAQGVVVSLMPYLLILDIVISIIAAYLYSKRLTKPIIMLSDTAACMQELTPNISSNVLTNDELGLLSQNLDALYVRFCATIETLKLEMDKVSEMEKSKTDFMRAASHELKTPLAALNGITEGMIDGIGVYVDKQRYLHESKKLIHKMTMLVEEILTASKLEYLRETIRFQDVDISAIIDSVLDDYKYEIVEKNLDVHFKREEFIYHTDVKIFTSALSNIISNAVRYADISGRIEIAFTGVELSIMNECAGIPESDLERLFEPFYVLDYSRDRSKNGTGIGLFIVKKNLDVLGIPYELANTGLGVRFTVRLE